MTPDEIEEIRERVEGVKAIGEPTLPDDEYRNPCCYWTNGDRKGEEIDCEFIRHSVGDVTRLLTALEEAEARVERCREALEEVSSVWPEEWDRGGGVYTPEEKTLRSLAKTARRALDREE